MRSRTVKSSTTVLACSLWISLAAPPAAAGAAADGGQDASLIALGKRVEAEVAELRGLAVRKPIEWRVASKEQIRTYVSRTLEQQYAEGELAREGLAYRALGLLPADLDYAAFVIDLLEEQVGGYYDPKKEIFFLADWIAPHLQETIIAHELCHALQDQHFDIDAFVEREAGASDAMLARSALVEGGATLVMMLYALEQSGVAVDPAMLEMEGWMGELMMSLSAAGFPTFARAPSALRRMLMFPYLKGLSFVGYGHRRGGWARIDNVYGDLPASSEQILHPAKYFDQRDAPTAVALDFAAAHIPAGWQSIYQDGLGEFGCDLLLEPVGERAEIERAAAGWDGDRFQVFQNGERLAWMSWSVWDTERDAVEFAGAFAKTVRHRHPDFERQPVGDQPLLRWRHADGRAVLLARRGPGVLIVDGLPAAAAEALLGAAP